MKYTLSATNSMETGHVVEDTHYKCPQKQPLQEHIVIFVRGDLTAHAIAVLTQSECE